MKKLKRARLSKGLRLREVAEKLSIAPQTVQQQEQRGVRTVRVAKLYAVALGCKPEDLLEF